MDFLNILTGVIDHVIVTPVSSIIESISEATCSKNYKPKCYSDFSYDCENWMGNLPNSIRENIPIINLAIPGTHNSGTFAVSGMSGIAPDADQTLYDLHKAFPNRVGNWAKTQEYTFRDQLYNGIRYFDLRLAPMNDDIYFVHGVYSTEVTNSLNEISNFLRSHPNEFVFVDCQKFYKFLGSHHEKFKNKLLGLFGDILFCSTSDFPCLTLSMAKSIKKQLVIIYRDNNTNAKFFSSYYFPSPWADTTCTDKLKNFLEEKIKSRNPNVGHCTQLILTPDGGYIGARFHLSLKNTCARHVMNDLNSFLNSQTPGRFNGSENGKVNVVIADFVEQDGDFFTRTVIDLNMKLR